MDLISLIIIIYIIVKIFKKNKPDEYEQARQKAKEIKNEVMRDFRANYDQRERNFEHRQNPQSQGSNYEMPKKNVRTTPVREQVRTVDAASTHSTQQYQMVKENDAARMQVQKKRMEAKNTTILQRAKANAEEEKADETLISLEAEHGHSAHVAPAIHHPEDEMPENMLGKIEDLMVKGYEGDLCFERDFVGEAMDMVSRFSLGGSIIDES